MPNLTHFTTRPRPSAIDLQGHTVRLQSLDWIRHGPSLARHLVGAEVADLWDYLPFGPFETADDFQATLSAAAERGDWESLVIILPDGEAVGTASYLRIRPEHGSAEIGCVVFGHVLQKTRAATESFYLMMSHLFETLGYRRCEWKCDNVNAASKRAAERLGFQYEGLFRQDRVTKGRNRDTAWYSIIDTEWPVVKAGFEAWLSDENFEADGTQVRSLAACRAAAGG